MCCALAESLPRVGLSHTFVVAASIGEGNILGVKVYING